MPKSQRTDSFWASAAPLLPAAGDGEGECAKGEDGSCRALAWKCGLKVALGFFVLYVAWWAFLGLFPPPSSPSPSPKPLSPAALCAIPVANYNETKEISDQCDIKPSWESQAGISRVDDGGCYMDEKTRQILCSRDESCEGGHRQVHRWNTLRRSLTYDCRRCAGTLRVNCCKECNSLQHGSSDYEYLHCLGCEKDALQNIVNKNTAICSRDERGYFSCEAKDTCSVDAKFSASNVSHSYSCAITPCDKCTNPQLHAKCCAICLGALCGKPEDRQVCIGCSKASLTQYGQVQRLLSQSVI